MPAGDCNGQGTGGSCRERAGQDPGTGGDAVMGPVAGAPRPGLQIEGFGNRASVVCQRRNPVDMGVGVYPTLALQLPCP